MRNLFSALRLLLAVLAFFLPAARAAEAPASETKSPFLRFLEQDYLLGDWGGWRSKLSGKGVDFEFFYYGAMPSNLDGGLRRGTVFQNALAMTLDLDTEKLFDLPNGRFHAGSIYIHNDRFSPDYVGDLNVSSLIDFPDTLRLWELWYEHKFFNDKLSIKAGQMAIDSDFLIAEYSRAFINQTFFFPTLAFNVYDQALIYPIGHHALSSTPYGSPGVRLRVDPTDSLTLQAGIYDGNPDRSYHGIRFNVNEEEGALAYFEAAYRRNHRTNDIGLFGSYKIGGYLHTDDFYDNYEDENGNFYILSGNPQRVHSNNYGFYFLADQMLYREVKGSDPAQQGLGSFFRLTAAPDDRNLASYGIDGGITYKGAIPTRDWDTAGVAASYLGISSDLRRAISEASPFVRGLTVPDYEAVIEATYKAQITAWWTLQPSLQWALHPGGTRATPDALVFVLQTTLRF